MASIVFQGSSDLPVEVNAWLGKEVTGWFVLERMRPGGAGDYEMVAKSVKAPQADDDITHQFPISELAAAGWASLKLRLRVNGLSQSNDKALLYLRITQRGIPLEAFTRTGEPLNDNKQKRVELGEVSSNVPDLFDFTVWF